MKNSSSRPRLDRRLGWAAVPMLAGLAMGPTARADTALAISNAWSPVQPKSGADTPLFMNISNSGGADALVRVRCPVANFTEKRTIDLGEGAPSSREVKAIPIPSGQTVLKADGAYVLLLQIVQPLADGETFSCKVAFQSGANQDVEVIVKSH